MSLGKPAARHTHEAETVRVRMEPDSREHQDTWTVWTYGNPSKTVAMAKYCHGEMEGRTSRAMKQGKSHWGISE